MNINKLTEPNFFSKFVTLFSVGLLWASTMFSAIMIPLITQLDSEHSYLSEKINGELWIYIYLIVSIYTIISTLYLGISDQNAKYKILGWTNSVILLAFIITTFFSFFNLFSN